MPRSKEQFEKIRRERRALIENTALQLFAKHGYHSTSINMIATAAGISKGLLYNYFESKEALIKGIVIDGMKLMLEHFNPNKDGFLSDDEMLLYIEQFFKMTDEHKEYLKLYFSVMVQQGVFGLVEKEVWEVVEPVMQIAHNYFERHGSKNPMADMRLFNSMLDGIAMNYVFDPDNFPLEAVKERVIEIYKKQ